MIEFFKKLFSPFSRLKSALGSKLSALFSRGGGEEIFEQMEQLFYEADLGATLSAELAEKARRFSRSHSADSILPFLKKELLALFPKEPPPLQPIQPPRIILVVGVNGSGKTTTIGKLAAHYKKQGKSILLAAADTFRAAAVEQLESWAKWLALPVVKSQPNSDPSAVVFDALTAAKARQIDLVLIDTAGRLQTKTDLMEELAKIRRVCQKLVTGAPHETLLVLDATLGQNALDQARIFHQFTPITAIALVKLDGSAKGGVALAIQKELNIPILWAGLGEKEEDLIPFDPKGYLDALFGERC